MAGDKLKNVVSVADLETEVAENEDPITIALKSGKRITFPDVYDMPLAEAEAFFREVARAQGSGVFTPVLDKWLPKEDVKALTEAFPTYRRLNPVVQRVMQKYEAQWGSEGEGDASAS